VAVEEDDGRCLEPEEEREEDGATETAYNVRECSGETERGG